FFSSSRRHTRFSRDWSSDVCSSDLSFKKIDALGGSVQWPCNEEAPDGTPIMHVDEFVRGKGRFMITKYVPSDERSTRKFPLLLKIGRASCRERGWRSRGAGCP